MGLTPADGVSINVFFGETDPPTSEPADGNPISYPETYEYEGTYRYFRSVDTATIPDKILESVTAPAAVTGVTNGTAKTASALGLPTAVTLVTDDGSVSASVTWDVAGSSYDPAATAEQTFTVDGAAELPSGVANPNGVSLDVTISVTVDAAAIPDKILVSVTAPAAITGVANGTAKTATALGLPTTVTLVTNEGNVSAGVTWDVAGSAYDPASGSAQTFTVDGAAELPSGIANPNGVSLDVTISVTVDAAAIPDKILVSVTAPAAITGVANGTAKTATALGLPTAVTLVTDDGSVSASVTWDVAGSSYDPAAAAEQTFTVDGAAELPSGVANPNSVSLDVTINVTVDAAAIPDKILVSVTAPAAGTGVANGTAKTASALGLPTTVTLVTDDGSVSASVTWDVAGSSYDPAFGSAQTFTINGTVSLPAGVINPNDVPLTTSISVTVDAAVYTPPPTYTLNVTAGTGGSATGSGNYEAGATVTITATPSSGYAFSQWTITSGEGTFGNANSVSTTFTMTAGAATVRAAFTPVGSSDDDPPPDIYVQGEDIVNYDDRVTIDLTKGSSLLSADQINMLIELNKDKPIILNGDGYTITFPKGSLKVVGGEKDYDFGVGFNTGSDLAVIKSLAGDNFLLMLDFNHSGLLPGEAKYRIYVGTQYARQMLFYYYYNPQTGRLDYIQATTVGPDGYVTIRQSRCSKYVLSLADDGMGDTPKTDGGGFPVGVGLPALGVLGGCLLLMTRKKKRAL